MPPVGMTDYTFALGDDGFVLNTDDMGMPFVDVLSVTGLDTAPLRVSQSEHHGSDGTYIDADHMSMRTIAITGELYTDPSSADLSLSTLKRDYNTPDIRPFYFQLPGQSLKFVNGQGGGLQYPIDGNRRSGKTPIQALILAADPYIYDYPPSIDTVSVPTVITVGTGFNMAFNVGFGGSVPGNSATVANYGTHTAYPIIQINGPVTNPVLVDAFGITMSFTISLVAGDQLVVNCKDRSVVLNGVVSRRNTLSGVNWFAVPPGMAETVFFSADAGTGNIVVTLYNTYY